MRLTAAGLGAAGAVAAGYLATDGTAVFVPARGMRTAQSAAAAGAQLPEQPLSAALGHSGSVGTTSALLAGVASAMAAAGVSLRSKSIKKARRSTGLAAGDLLDLVEAGGSRLPVSAALASRRRKPSSAEALEASEEAAPKTAKQSEEEDAEQQLIRAVAAQVLAVMAVTASPLEVIAADLPPATDAAPLVPTIQQATLQQPAPTTQQQQGARVIEGRATYSRLLEWIEEGCVKRVDFFDAGRIAVVEATVSGNPQKMVVDLPFATTSLLEKLQNKGVAIEVHTPEKPNQWAQLAGDLAIPAVLVAGLLFLRNRPGGGGMMGPAQGQSKAKVLVDATTGVKFDDVAGIDEAKEELTEVVDFLRAPERFVQVGAKIPSGVLLTGPPGTGKTLMAKALAGEAGVPFIQASASEFIEMFVGVGASRVRDIFKKAKDNAPCIVFIDEIDAIGRQRGAGMGGGNDEREQTLNQILTEMDGFDGNKGVIVVAATNRADILDQALLRPGRFDRRVTVDLPDVNGREQILKVHVKNKKLEQGVDLKEVAKRTSGMSGADLENLMNEAAILAARRSLQAISDAEIADATDRVIAGLAGRALTDSAAKRLVAYHEVGHALVGTLLPHHDEVNKVTLIPRGQAKGLTWFTPAEDQSLISQNMLKARIAGALGGRAAEQVVFGTKKVTSGAGGDLQQVERMARAMVTQLGMSQVGCVAIDESSFMGPGYSEDLASRIDKAVKAISDECYLRALEIVSENRPCLDRLADELAEVETMSGARLREIVAEYVEIPEKVAAV